MATHKCPQGSLQIKKSFLPRIEMKLYSRTGIFIISVFPCRLHVLQNYGMSFNVEGGNLLVL
jgi:hypothetical protein